MTNQGSAVRRQGHYWCKNKLGLSEYQMALVWVKGLVVAQTVHGTDLRTLK